MMTERLRRRNECEECAAVPCSDEIFSARVLRATRPSAARPVTAHARHDHRATRPEFLDIGGVTHAHRVRAGVVMRVDAFFLVGRNAKPGTANAWRRGR